MSADKRFAPTTRKLRKSRQQGDVAKSHEFTGAAALTAGAVTLFLCWHPLNTICLLIHSILMMIKDLSPDRMLLGMQEAASAFFWLLAPPLTFVFGGVLLAEVFQVGVSVSPDSIAFRLSRLNVGKGLKRIFGVDGEETGFPGRLAYDLLKTTTTVFGGVVLGAVVLVSCRRLYMQPAIDAQSCIAAVAVAIREELTWLIPAFLAIGSGDLLVARFQRTQRLRMDLEEFRREMRENEGNPELRGLRKQLHQELIVRSLVQGVRQASLVVLGRRRVR